MPPYLLLSLSLQVLRSYELLGLRRDRMSKRSSRDIERNQSLVLDMPGLLPRLLTLMRLANHGAYHMYIVKY